MIAENLEDVILNDGYYFEQGRAYQKFLDAGDTLTVTAGDLVGVRGWIGFDKEILAFGIAVGDVKLDNMIFDDFKEGTEAGVLAAGGEYASRYRIVVPTEGADPGEYTITWLALLVDYTIIKIHTITLVIT